MSSTDERLAEVRRAAETLLANTVIETFDVRVEPTDLMPAEDRRRHLPGLARRPRRAARRAAERAPSRSPLWHASDTLDGVDAVILPGGFSYGDYLRCGAISRFAPVMTEVIKAADARHCRCSASATASRSSARPTCCPAR